MKTCRKGYRSVGELAYLQKDYRYLGRSLESSVRSIDKCVEEGGSEGRKERVDDGVGKVR